MQYSSYSTMESARLMESLVAGVTFSWDSLMITDDQNGVVLEAERSTSDPERTTVGEKVEEHNGDDHITTIRSTINKVGNVVEEEIEVVEVQLDEERCEIEVPPSSPGDRSNVSDDSDDSFSESDTDSMVSEEPQFLVEVPFEKESGDDHDHPPLVEIPTDELDSQNDENRSVDVDSSTDEKQGEDLAVSASRVAELSIVSAEQGQPQQALASVLEESGGTGEVVGEGEPTSKELQQQGDVEKLEDNELSHADVDGDVDGEQRSVDDAIEKPSLAADGEDNEGHSGENTATTTSPADLGSGDVRPVDSEEVADSQTEEKLEVSDNLALGEEHEEKKESNGVDDHLNDVSLKRSGLALCLDHPAAVEAAADKHLISLRQCFTLVQEDTCAIL